VARRRGFSGPNRVTARRLTTWTELEATSTNITSAGGTILNSLNAALLAKRPFTVIRTHLMYQVTSDQIAASESYLGAVGIAVASEQAVAAGVASVPTPATDASSEAWFLHEWFTGEIIFGTGVGFTENNQMNRVDSKAMRKVDDGENLYMAVELELLSGFTFTAAGRLLIKEH